jgi:hypothetical protein
MRAFPQNPPKTPVYDALAILNRDFEQVLVDLKRLETLRLFPRRWQRKVLKTWRATLEETRAWANFEVIEVLHQREEREWVSFGRIRQRSENHLRLSPTCQFLPNQACGRPRAENDAGKGRRSWPSLPCPRLSPQTKIGTGGS